MAIYSPREGNRTGAVVRRFTAIGTVGAGRAYRLPDDPHGSWCRDVGFEEIHGEASVEPLLTRLGFVRAGAGWGVVFRPGFLAIDAADFSTLRRALTDPRG